MQFQKKHWLFFYSLISTLTIFLYQDYKKIHPKHLKINYLDIGQGDATLVITPQNQKILIDTGPAGNLNKTLKKYLSFFDKKIDIFILTHPDSDHIGDIPNILKSYKIQKIILPKSIHKKAEYKMLINQIQSKNIPYLFANNYTDIIIDNNIVIDFLYPFTQSTIHEQNSFHNASLVFKLIHQNNTFFFSGDAEKKQEKLIIQSLQNLQSDIYQAGHHGSKSSSTEIFLQAIQPKITIISAGKDNSFGHPHQKIIERLQKKDIKILETSKENDITFYSNGIKYWKE